MNNFLKKIFHHSNQGFSSSIPFRLNFIFISVGILFIVLIGQLVYLQILYGSQFKAEVNESSNNIKYGNVQRGMVYDSTGKLLVGNKNHRAITYTKGISTSNEIYQTATKLAKYVSVPTDTLTKNQKIEYYLASTNNASNVAKKIKNIYSYAPDARAGAEKDYVSSHFSSFPFNKQALNAAEIFTEMNDTTQFGTTYIKSSNVSNREYAEVGERQSEMPGVETGTSYSQYYPGGKSISSIIGTVSSEKSGLPSDQVNQLLAKGYSRNDSVGQSYLEQRYEPVLRGSKSQTKIDLIHNDQIGKEIKKYGGQRGDNLQLTVNSKFQYQLQQDINEAEHGSVGNSTGAYAVVMNPHTGAVLGMAGVNRNPSSGKLTANDLGAINNDIVMGSVVKGATVSGALMDHVITPDDSTMVDKPILVGGTKQTSWFNKNGSANMAVDASTALEVSSNSYMMQLAMKEANFHYYENAPATINPDIFTKLRGYFNQFGLGIKTGIDLPGETTGLQGSTSDVIHGLNLAYGNYDEYTTLQVAQYMSTIANGGYRIQPHIVQSIRGTNSKGGLGSVKYSVTPKVLNEINMTPSERNVVTQGLYDVVHGTNQYKTGINLNTIHPSVSAKTGTAETTTNGNSTVTLSLASYAPSSDPQVVVALAMPGLPENAEDNNTNLAKQIYSDYWKDVQSTSTIK
ncbi:penicillin-binding protein [Philodulcilactobacillus myokoensis]|uniref:Penicillin-binding protein n=1 Tax=Philodulcilactobacillus myokoensis TaxID=2929573 RepID=A0A9W6ET50_9LACO|nr:penicillin-binding protein 2 [Philodulcilactobacillus myokoensis]GLB46779.1 penicillin-binding protein [Philodulcilactobacillus myokoensis]